MRMRIGGNPVAQPRNSPCAVLPAGTILWEIKRRSSNPNSLRQQLMKVIRGGVQPIPRSHPVVSFKRIVRSAGLARMAGKPPWEGAILLRVVFWMPRPQAKCWKTKPMPAYPHIKKPDLDNLIKSVKDALTGVVYQDDAQVQKVFAEKWVCSGDRLPCTVIEWEELRQESWEENQPGGSLAANVLTGSE